MGENTSQIEQEIRAERSALGRHLNELETKARDLADWRAHHRNHPGLFMGVAFGGGVLLGLLAISARQGGNRSGMVDAAYDAGPRPARLRMPRVVSHTSELAGRQLGQTWDHIADALLGMLAAKAVEFVGELVPGFREHYRGAAMSDPGSYRRETPA